MRMNTNDRIAAVEAAAMKEGISYGTYVSKHTEEEIRRLYAPFMRRKNKGMRKEREGSELYE